MLFFWKRRCGNGKKGGDRTIEQPVRVLCHGSLVRSCIYPLHQPFRSVLFKLDRHTLVRTSTGKSYSSLVHSMAGDPIVL